MSDLGSLFGPVASLFVCSCVLFILLCTKIFQGQKPGCLAPCMAPALAPKIVKNHVFGSFRARSARRGDRPFLYLYICKNVKISLLRSFLSLWRCPLRLAPCGIDSAQRAASIGEVSAPEDIIRKSYGKMKFDFFQEIQF